MALRIELFVLDQRASIDDKPIYRVFYHRLHFLDNHKIIEQVGSYPRDETSRIKTKELPDQTFLEIVQNGKDTLVRHDPIGNQLEYIYAADWQTKVRLPDDLCKWDFAVDLYIRALPPDTPIILYWL